MKTKWTPRDLKAYWEQFFGTAFFVIPGSENINGYPLFTSVVEISPLQGEEILRTHNLANRKAKPIRARRMTGKINSGLWVLNGQPIQISWLNELADGQHRLMGVADAAKSITSVLQLGVNPGAFVSMDTGGVRTLDDMAYIDGVQNHQEVSRAVPYLISFLSRGDFNPAWRNDLERSREHELSTTRRHAKLDQAAGEVKAFGKSARIFFSSGALIALHYIFSRADPILASKFIPGMLSMEFGTEQAWARAKSLVMFLVDQRSRQQEGNEKRIRDIDVAHWLIETWNITRDCLRSGRAAKGTSRFYRVQFYKDTPYQTPRISGIEYSPAGVPILVGDYLSKTEDLFGEG